MNRKQLLEVDAWVKEIKREYSELNEIVNEQSICLGEDYDMIEHLHNEIQSLKQEINAIKLIQIIQLKQNTVNKNVRLG